MAERLNGQYTQEQVEQVLGRTARLYTVHLLGSEGDDDDSGSFYLSKNYLNKYLRLRNSGTPHPIWTKSGPIREMHKEALVSIDRLAM